MPHPLKKLMSLVFARHGDRFHAIYHWFKDPRQQWEPWSNSACGSFTDSDSEQTQSSYSSDDASTTQRAESRLVDLVCGPFFGVVVDGAAQERHKSCHVQISSIEEEVCEHLGRGDFGDDDSEELRGDSKHREKSVEKQLAGNGHDSRLCLGT